jgi:hypothetical protein
LEILRSRSNSAKPNKHNLWKISDGEALFTSLFHTYASTYVEVWDSLQLGSKESRQEVALQAKQNTP